MAHLTIQQDGKTTVIEIAEPVTTIGRHQSCTIQLLDTKASRQHCQIEECDAGSGYKLVDLKSANGTIVNGEACTHRILEAGDIIEIGAAIIKYEIEGKDILKQRRKLGLRGKSRGGRRGTARRRPRPLQRPPSRDNRPSSIASGDYADAYYGDDEDESGDGYETSRESDPGSETQRLGVTPSETALQPVSGDAIMSDVNPKDRAEVAITIRRLMNTLITQHDEDGLVEVERIFEEFMDEGAVEPHIQALIEDRELMASVLEINKAINSELQLDGLLDKILDETINFTNAERGFLILVEALHSDPVTLAAAAAAAVTASQAAGQNGKDAPAVDKARVERARNFDREDIPKADDKFSRGIVNEVITHGRPLLSTNAHEEERFNESDSVLQQRLLSVLCVPLRVKDRIIGVLYIDNRFETGVFSERDLLWLESIGDQAAIAIENARTNHRLAAALEEVSAAHERLNELNELLEHKLEAREIELANLAVRPPAAKGDRSGYKPKYNYDEIIGRSPPMRRVFEILDKATDASEPVVILGGNGTGKELIARALHRNGPRKDKPFVAENCGAIPENLVETTFFGSVKGAYTGATDKAGHFEVAHNGTLFMDEIGELPLDLQASLLRVLADGEVRRVGDSKTRKVNVRIVCATNRDLQAMVKAGQFREDLYYRLNVLTIPLPDLKDRRDDIPEMAAAFFKQAFEKNGIEPKPIAAEVYDELARHNWPGNVRELLNIVSRIVSFNRDRAAITADCVPDDLRQGRDDEQVSSGMPDVPQGTPLKDAVKQITESFEGDYIYREWKANRFKKVDTAQALGISRPTLDAKIEVYKLQDRRKAEEGDS
ncbi:MAG: sigma 54-interacting transcriptional regulator [Planctomycetota bacterium]